MTDHPDWLGVSAGSLRYLGSVAGSGTLAVSLNPQERAIIVVVPANALGTTTVTVKTASGIATKLSTFPVSATPTPGLCIAYANPAISASWQVVTTADPSQTCYVFADSDLGTVAIASDQTAPVYAQVVNNGPLSGGGAVTPLYVQIVHGNADLIGQQLMGSSIPVVVASDQSPVAVRDAGTTLVGSLTYVSNATPGSVTSAIMLGGSVGVSYRIMAVTFTGIYTLATTEMLNLWITDSGGVALDAIGSVTGYKPGMHVVIPGGVRLPSGSGIYVAGQSNVASRSARVNAYYRTD